MSEELVTAAIELGEQILKHIFNLSASDIVINIEKRSDFVSYKITGQDVSLYIGKHGYTLEAIQHIIDKVVNKKSNQRIRVHVDIEGYLDERKTNLQKLALRLAEKVKRTHKSSTINQLNPYDRRIIHLVLKNQQKVRTHSIGSGYYRKLVIIPKNKKPRKLKPAALNKNNTEKKPMS